MESQLPAIDLKLTCTKVSVNPKKLRVKFSMDYATREEEIMGSVEAAAPVKPKPRVMLPANNVMDIASLMGQQISKFLAQMPKGVVFSASHSNMETSAAGVSASCELQARVAGSELYCFDWSAQTDGSQRARVRYYTEKGASESVDLSTSTLKIPADWIEKLRLFGERQQKWLSGE